MGSGGKPDVNTDRRNMINSVLQALKALDYFEMCGGEAGVIEISEALGVHKSTASRLLATMASRGYLARNNATQKYSLGVRIIALARTKLEQFELRAYARPYLEELSRKTGETIHLAIIDQEKLFYIDKIDCAQTLTMRSSIGGQIPLHCTGLGKAILAASNRAERQALLKTGKLQGYTLNTITDLGQLIAHLDLVRSRGYAIDDQEHEEGIRCVAAVVWDYNEKVAGAISISGPTIRVSEDRTEELGALVKDVCHRLSRSVGSPIRGLNIS